MPKWTNEQLDAINLDGENSRIRISQGLIFGSANFLRLFLLYVGSDLFNIKFKFFFMSSKLLFLCFLQKIILKNKIYRHHIASFITIRKMIDFYRKLKKTLYT